MAAGKVLIGMVTSTYGPRARNSAKTSREICDKFGKDFVGKEFGPFWSPRMLQGC